MSEKEPTEILVTCLGRRRNAFLSFLLTLFLHDQLDEPFVLTNNDGERSLHAGNLLVPFHAHRLELGCT